MRRKHKTKKTRTKKAILKNTPKRRLKKNTKFSENDTQLKQTLLHVLQSVFFDILQTRSLMDGTFVMDNPRIVAQLRSFELQCGNLYMMVNNL